MDEMTSAAQNAEAQARLQNCQTNMTNIYHPSGIGSGCLTGLGHLSEQLNAKARAQQAIGILQQAASIRKDVALIAAVRAYIRDQRNELAAVLDDIGG